jgi:PAS domain S-box-containing protein
MVVIDQGNPSDNSLVNEAQTLRDEQLRLAEAAGIGVWDIDVASDTVRGNAQYFRILGMEPTDGPVPMPVVRAFRLPGDREKVIAGFVEAIRTGADAYENEFRISRKDGEIRWVFGRGRVVRDPLGRPIRFSGVDIDVTEQKRAAQAAQRLAAIVESSHDAIIGKDLGGTITSWNPSAERMFGYTAQEMIGQSVTTIVPKSHSHEERLILEKILVGERVEAFDTMRRHKSGRLVQISLAVSPILSTDGAIIGASKIARDITESKEAEQRIELLMGELTHRVKNQYSVILSMLRETGRHVGDLEEFQSVVTERVSALSRSHDLLITGNWTGVTLSELISAQLKAFSSSDVLALQGPGIMLSPTAVQYFGMAFHELATNAVKYGALGKGEGRIEVNWQITSESRLQLTWRELNPFKVDPGASSGFGSTVLQRIVPSAVSGVGEICFEDGGLVWSLEAPMVAIQSSTRD